jgi:predicted DCC family thiol-disulfide oxidoreductase YuxK
MRSLRSAGFVLLCCSTSNAFSSLLHSSSSVSRTCQHLSATTAVDGSVNDSSSSSTDASAVVVDWDWETLASNVFTEDKRPIVLFDGVCNLCSGGVNYAMDQDETAKFRFCSIQSKVAQSLLVRAGVSPNENSNIALLTEDDSFFSSDAVSRICMELDAAPLQWFGQLGQWTPDWIRESIYELVSTNRYQFGETDSCRLDFDGTYTSRFVSDPTTDD